jgi:hypothetical protein
MTVSEAELDKARKDYLHNLILQDLLQNASMKHAENHLVQTVYRRMCIEKRAAGLVNSFHDDMKLLGLDFEEKDSGQFDWLSPAVSAERESSFDQIYRALKHDVEKQLKEIVLSVYSTCYRDTDESDCSERVKLMKAIQIPTLLQAKIDHTEQLRDSVWEKTRLYFKELLDYCEILFKGLATIHELIFEYKVPDGPRQEDFMEYFSALFDTMYLKLKYTYFRLVLGVFGENQENDLRNKLKSKKHSIIEEYSKAEKTRIQLQQKLKQFDLMRGSEFDQIVKMYAELEQGISELQRDISLLQNNN